MNKAIMIAVLMLGISTVSSAKENGSADAQAVDAACAQDAATAGCGSEKVGTGLLKCLHTYKKAHSEFKFSDSCKAAMKTMRKDKKGSK